MATKMKFFDTIFFLLTIGLTEQTGLDQFKLPLEGSVDLSNILGGTKSSLLCFINSQNNAGGILDIFTEAAGQLDKEVGTMHIVDCSDEGKAICENLEVSPEPYIIQHYADGKFKKVYKGEASLDNLLTFMKDPEKELLPETTQSIAIDLEEKDFESFLKTKKHGLVMFMAPWCIHCKNTKPQFLAAAESFSDNPMYAFAIVDCTKNSVFCENNGIDGYPTINYYHFFDKLPSEEYLGEHDKSSIIEFMTKMEQEIESKVKTEL